MKINQHIYNLDVEEMNRNTRYFKDYLKDQIKESTKRSTKRLPKITNKVFKRQDSLTHNIQKESAAPLRRLTARSDLSIKKKQKVNHKLINQKIGISLKKLFGDSKTYNSNKSVKSKTPHGGGGGDTTPIESSYQFTSSSDNENESNRRIKR